MPLPTISTLPTPPSRSSAPATFSNDADAFFNAFPTLVAQVNDWSSQLPAAVNGIDYNGTSTTSNTIGTGAKTFTTQTGKNFQIGQFVVVANTATPANFMTGQVTAYNSGTGSLTVNVTATGGAGTFSAWTISLSASSAAYLPLSGGALTGALTGTSGAFSGNLLAGTASVKNRLTVVAAGVADAPSPGMATGIAYFSNNDPSYGLAIGTTAGDGHAWLQAMRTDGIATALNITLNEGGGNVGIGTSGPTALLEVRRDQAGVTESKTRNGGTGASAIARWGIFTGSANTFVLGALTDNSGAGAAVFEMIGGAGVGSFLYTMDVHTFRSKSGSLQLSLSANGDVSSPNNSAAAGYKGLPPNPQVSAYTLAFSDMGKLIYATAGSFTITIPTNSTVAFPLGTAITIIVEDATKTVAGAAGVTLAQAGSGTTGSRTLAIGAVATIIKVGTDRWYISGAGVS